VGQLGKRTICSRYCRAPCCGAIGGEPDKNSEGTVKVPGVYIRLSYIEGYATRMRAIMGRQGEGKSFGMTRQLSGR